MILKWLRDNIVPAFIASLVIVVLAVMLFNQWQRARSAKTEASLATGQTGAALESGADGVNTVGNRMDADAASDRLTQENEDAIRAAEGANETVPASVGNAGLASLCRRVVYRDKPECVQYADSR